MLSRFRPLQRRLGSRMALVAGLAAAMGLAADPALAAGTVVGGVSTLLGLLAALWAVLVARGSSLEADGAAVWLVGGAVVGSAGWAGRRLLIERLDGAWRQSLDRWSGMLRWVERHATRFIGPDGGAIATGGGARRAASPTFGPLIHACPEITWPACFDRDQVLAEARRCFVALQAAWDAHDIASLAELTTPDMLLDVRALLDARGPGPNHTEVLSLDAELLCIEAIGAAWCASLEFSGFIRESVDAPAAPFRELWLLAAPKDGAVRWRLARQQALL